MKLFPFFVRFDIWDFWRIFDSKEACCVSNRACTQGHYLMKLQFFADSVKLIATVQKNYSAAFYLNGLVIGWELRETCVGMGKCGGGGGGGYWLCKLYRYARFCSELLGVELNTHYTHCGWNQVRFSRGPGDWINVFVFSAQKTENNL